MSTRVSRFAAAALGLVALGAGAHHSFAVFFDESKTVTVQGRVTEFHFRNPHGMVAVQVGGAGDATVVWKAETNSPSIMQRRGWTKQSLKVGDAITIEGWPARDGSRYMRVRSIKDADGKLIGRGADVASEQR